VQLGALLRPPLRRKALVAFLMCSFLLCAYWGLFTWIPRFLSAPLEKGGAALGIVKSAGWIVPMQLGAFFGYASFGFLADRFGRRPVFLAFVLGAAALVPLYGSLRSETWLLLLGPPLGFLGHGYFSVFGSMLAEIFPSSIRATAQGFAYNGGRALSALAPWMIGALADSYGIGTALAFMSLFFVVGAAMIFLLPETKGEALA
jgi:MFS family permease